MPEMIKVTQAAEINAVAALAHDIWNRHFVPIIGQEQVDYMLDKFQSAPAIARQIASGYEYYLVVHRHGRIGYFAIVPNPSGPGTQLSKIYVREDQRRHGVGNAIMAFVEERCRELGAREVWLTVNRHNAGPIAFYERAGFTTSESLVQDIGSGFVMDDFKMVKKISS